MNDSRSLMNSRRRFLALSVTLGFVTLTGCGDAEVGSAPPVGKSRKELLGDGPKQAPPKTKGSKTK